MAENYTKAQRDRRDFDRNMKTLERENRIALNNIANEKAATAASMLDIQSKSKNLSETITFIRDKLISEKRAAEQMLRKMNQERSNAKNGGGEVEDISDVYLDKLQQRVTHCRGKLDWLDPKKSAIKQSIAVMDILTSKTQGFGGILHRIRAKKHPEPEADEEEAKEPEPPRSPKDIIGLIDHFKTLPKLYPVKPKKKKPKQTQVMMEKYQERKKEREKAMSYGTRRRLKRVEFHCESLKDLFLSEPDLKNIRIR